jgi:hypothetical protein
MFKESDIDFTGCCALVGRSMKEDLVWQGRITE